MKCRMDKTIRIVPSMCDNTSKLSLPAIFSLFMDLASEHGSNIALGSDVLADKGLFWLTVKTKIKIVGRPALLTDITASTWPEVPQRVKCNRYYALYQGGKTIITGKTEWAMLETDSGKFHHLSDVFPQEFDYCDEKVCNEPYSRMSKDFADCPAIYSYTIRSTDIDLGQHMNNAVYLRVLFSAFSCKELEEMNITETEIAFCSPSYEGDILTLRKRNTEDAMEIGMIKQDGTVCAIVKIK